MLQEASSLPINELYGPTLQGEGPDIGKACLFLRLHNCPVHCPGCDTAFTWNGKEKSQIMTVDEVMLKLNGLRGGTKVGLVVSGGEPLLYYRSQALRNILSHFPWTSVETSGYAGDIPMENWDFRTFCCSFTSISLSPKITPCLHGRQTDEQLEHNIPVFMNLKKYSINLFFKFVVKDQADIDAILACDKRHGFTNSYRVYLMPYGNNRDEILKSVETLIPVAVKYGFIITPRLHSLLWGSKRGR